MTLDSTSQIGRICTALEDLHWRVYVRLIFDRGMRPETYLKAVRQISDVAVIMGQIADLNVTEDYLRVLGKWIPVWELQGGQDQAKVTAAHQVVRGFQRNSALSLYWQSPLEMLAWAMALPLSVRQTMLYVLVSCHEEIKPVWTEVFRDLGSIFPNAWFGIGDCGTDKKQLKEGMIRRYYSMKVNYPRFIGGYFWRHGYQDFVPRGKPLWVVLNETLKVTTL